MVHGPAVCEHCIATAQLQPGRKPKREPLSEPELAALFKAVQEWEAWLSACETSAPEGFIAARRTGMQGFLVPYVCHYPVLYWWCSPFAAVPQQAWDFAAHLQAYASVILADRGAGGR